MTTYSPETTRAPRSQTTPTPPSSPPETGRRPEEERDLRARLRTESPAGLIAGMACDLSTLVRKEIALGRAEVSEKIDQARSGAIQITTGALVSYAGTMFLLLAATAGLATVMPFWGAALIVGGVVLAAGFVLLGTGRSDLRMRNLEPERTLSSLRKDAQLAKPGRDQR